MSFWLCMEEASINVVLDLPVDNQSRDFNDMETVTCHLHFIAMKVTPSECQIMVIPFETISHLARIRFRLNQFPKPKILPSRPSFAGRRDKRFSICLCQNPPDTRRWRRILICLIEICVISTKEGKLFIMSSRFRSDFRPSGERESSSSERRK